jgi:hypothetical protein
MIYCTGSLKFNKGSGTGAFTISGLPIAPVNVSGNYSPVSMFVTGLGSANETVQAHTTFNSTVIHVGFAPEGTGADTNAEDGDLAAPAYIKFSLMYRHTA